VLKQAEAGTLAPQLCYARHQLGDVLQAPQQVRWHGCVADIPQLKELQGEKRRLKKMYADAQPSAELLKDVMAKKW
jgi:putative transposase